MFDMEPGFRNSSVEIRTWVDQLMRPALIGSRWTGLVLLVLLLLTTAEARAANTFSPLYSVQGFIKYTQRIGPKEIKAQYWTYQVAEDDARRWRIKIHTEQSVRGVPIRSNVSIAYDGTNVYSLTTADVFKINPLNPFHFEKLTNAAGVSVANICTGPYPIDSSSVVGVLWLAYFSGGYLNPTAAKTKFPDLTVPDARMDPMAWSCDLAYQLGGSSRHRILRDGRFEINPHYVRPIFSDYPELDEPANGGQADRQLFYTFAFMKTLKQTAVAAVYIMEDTTNVNETIIPSKFHVEVPTFAFGFGTNGYSRFDGQVTNCQAATAETLLPRLGDDVTIRDRRLRVKASGASIYRSEVIYVVTNRVWPTDTNDARVQAAANDPHAGWRRVYSGPYDSVLKPNPQYIRFFIVLLCFLPIVLFGARKYARRKN